MTIKLAELKPDAGSQQAQLAALNEVAAMAAEGKLDAVAVVALTRDGDAQVRVAVGRSSFAVVGALNAAILAVLDEVES